MTARISSSSAALAVLAVAQFVIALDYSIIYVALPSMARGLSLEPAAAQWVISSYAVGFAGFLMVGGRLADRLGAKRLFLVAVNLFCVASAVGGVARDGAVLLAARGTQGLAAALLQPATLGLIGTVFPAGPARNRALAVWAAVGAAGLAAGALLGGVLTTASWRLTFFVNVPLTLACALAAARYFRPAPAGGGSGRVPVLASTAGTGAALALVLGLTLSAGRGWGSAPALISFGVAVVLLAAFVVIENTARAVLIERALRRTRSLRSGAAATALYMASAGSEFYLVTLLLQERQGYPPLRAGLAFLPLALMITAGSMTAGRAVRRLTAGAVLACGFTLAAIGLGWLALALPGGSYLLDLLPGLVISGFGHGLIYTSMFILGTRDVPAGHQGSAGALLATSQYLSGAVMVAVLTLVLGAGRGTGSFQAAFLLTAVAAVAGLVLAVASAPRPGPAAVIPAIADNNGDDDAQLERPEHERHDPSPAHRPGRRGLRQHTRPAAARADLLADQAPARVRGRDPADA
jgi:MFS family permease